MVADSNAFAIAQGATTPTLSFTLKTAAGVPINLTGNTVAFNLRNLSGTIVGGGACVLDPDQVTNPGKVTRTFSAGDTANVGEFYGDFTISGPLAQTVPADPALALIVTVYALAYPLAVTLGAIRRALAPRLGYYFRVEQGDSQVNPTLTIGSLITSDENDEMLGRWVLALEPVDPADRLRQITDFDRTTGKITVDHDYANTVVTGPIEIHAFHPDQQLLPCILGGLDHCFFIDESPINLAGQLANINLSQQTPWIRAVDQLYDLTWQVADTLRPSSYRNPDLLMSGANVWLRQTVAIGTGTLLVTSRRSYKTLVNGRTQIAGPSQENDVLAVPLEYAVAWAHSEAWRLFPDLLVDAARNGLAPTRADVATEATRQSATWFHPPQPRIAVGPMRRVGGRWPSVVINAPEAGDFD